MSPAGDSGNGTRYRILSFDGGGVHALTYLPALRAIEGHLRRTLGQPKLCLADSGRFNMLVGTSTGAIVATALKLGYSADEVIDLYRLHAADIFTPLWHWDRFFHKYSSLRLNRILSEEFDRFREKLGSNLPDLCWRDLAWMPTEGKPANKSACNRPRLSLESGRSLA